MTEFVVKRIVIYPKDVMILTGRGHSTSRKFIANMKKKLGKSYKDFITIDEFCEETGFKVEYVAPLLK